jgi:fructose-specific phosphotransferase system IIC component
MKNIGIVGSSGGHLFVLGGKDPQALLEEILKQAKAASISVTDIVFVAASTSLDKANKETSAGLWKQTVDGPKEIFRGSLAEVNEKAKEENQKLGESIRSGEVNGVILVSADPKNVNKPVIDAAAKANIPVAGTGGTSMAETRSMGGNVIAASGTTGTTNRTRAVGYISAFAKEWKLKYTPIIGKVTETATGSFKERINVRSIMLASLPAFIAMALILAIGKIPFLQESVGPLFDVLIGMLPIVIATIAAKQVSGLDEVGIIAGVIAGALSVGGGILGGIIGGILAGILANVLLRWAFKMKFPTTTASLVSGAVSGLVAGALVYFILAPITLYLGNGIRDLIEIAIDFNAILAGAIAGALIWPAIIGGVYHAAILPIVLIEMEEFGYSFLGAVDMTGLVMVSAGITLANIITPRKKSEAAVALPGFLINIGFGTFVEAAYPFMFADKKVFATAILSAAVSGAFCGFFDARGTAYVPSVVAPGLSNNPVGFLVSMLVAMGLAIGLTVFFNKTAKKVEEEVVA